MNMIKIGEFLRTLRREKGLTQEQLADKFGVSNRTVSRWETGHNMPDFDVLIELSDFYEVDLRELLEGERENMKKEKKDMLCQVTDYEMEQAEKVNRKVRLFNLIATILLVLYISIKDMPIYNMNSIVHNLTDFSQGLSIGILLAGVFISSRYGRRVRKFKNRIRKKVV